MVNADAPGASCLPDHDGRPDRRIQSARCRSDGADFGGVMRGCWRHGWVPWPRCLVFTAAEAVAGGVLGPPWHNLGAAWGGRPGRAPGPPGAGGGFMIPVVGGGWSAGFGEPPR